MGAKIPPNVLDQTLEIFLGRVPLHRGKVRDIYKIDGHPACLLVHTTNRISIYDVVLPALVPDKGEVLTAMTVFWLERLAGIVPHHLVAYGAEVNRYLSQPLPPEILGRILVVKSLEMLPIECVVRGYLTGSGWQSYQKDRTICGQCLPEGLYDGAELPRALFTPTSKSETGHDQPLTIETVTSQYGQAIGSISIQLYLEMLRYALSRGIIIADTKFEFGFNRDGTPGLVLGDEVGTPDSSRFWLQKDWEKAINEGKSPPGLDKQPVREWGKEPNIRIDQRDPENPDDIRFVHQLEVPADIIAQTTERYRYIFFLLTGYKLEEFQRKYGIPVDLPRIRLDIVLSNEKDLSLISHALENYSKLDYADIHVHILSFQSNPEVVDWFCANYDGKRVIIACDHKGEGLMRLTTILNWRLRAFGKTAPILGVIFEKNEITPSSHGTHETVFSGPEGFGEACKMALNSEFLLPPPQPFQSQIDIVWRMI